MDFPGLMGAKPREDACARPESAITTKHFLSHPSAAF